MTKIDAVCVALTALWQGIAEQVVDGPQANSEASNEWLFVGSDGGEPDEGMEAAAAEQDWLAFAKLQQESVDITCAITVRSGDTDATSLRTRAYVILAAADAALRTDLTLGGLVMQSRISGHQYNPVVSTSGSLVRVVFTVTYLAQL